MGDKSILIVFGTRPEAIKVAPVYRAAKASGRLTPLMVSTGQHRELLASALAPLSIEPAFDLEVMTDGQTPNRVIQRVVERLSEVIDRTNPAAVVVQGDTTTALAAAVTAFNANILVAHVEAGLRTHDLASPFPEEANRQLIDRISRWCFVPTLAARENLLSERIATERIHVTGNTAVDSVLWAVERSAYRCAPNSVLVTMHRRESFGKPLQDVLLGLCDFLERTNDANAVWPVHPNPEVRRVIEGLPGARERLSLVPPMDYLTFAGALSSCRVVLTDSGGIQEEAPSLGKTVLVAREKTERPEALSGGRNRLVGRGRDGVRMALLDAWTEAPYDGPLPAANPFGDGTAGKRIVQILESDLTP